ncbi:MAG: hypothetical protein LBU66_02245, partial [Treponema sp.]|nr:hypothetical protein [Treponema sp.]
GAGFRAVTYDGKINGIPNFTAENQVTAIEIIETGSNTLASTYKEIIDRLHHENNTQRVLKIEWNEMQGDIAAGVDGRPGALPLSDYRELSFFVKGPQQPLPGAELKFVAGASPNDLTDYLLKAVIPLSAFKAGEWSKVTIRYQGDKTGVIVDKGNSNGGNYDGAYFDYKPQKTLDANKEGRAVYIAVLVMPKEGEKLDDGSICIDEIILEDPRMALRINAGAAVEYSRKGVLLSAGGMPVFSDLLISTALESEILTDENEDTQAAASLVNRSTAEISILETELKGNISFTAAEDTFLWNADHSVSRAFGLFSFKESFHASPWDYYARHNFNLDFSSDFFAKFDADALYEFSRLRQKWNFGTGYNSSDINTSIAVNAEAAWTKNNEFNENDNYGELWLNSWQPLIPDTGSGADARRTQTQIVFSQNSKPLGAIITLDGSSNFSGANSITRLDNSAYLDIPITLKNSFVNFRAGRGIRRQLYYSGDDALDDGLKFFESVNDALPLYGLFPGYSLFSWESSKTMERAIKNSPSADISQYSAFNDHFSARINFPPVYNLSSFFIPAKADLRLERVLEQKLDTSTDIFNLGSGLGFSAVNMFGRMGYLPLFKFYQSDEFAHSIQGAVIFNGDDDITWRAQSIIGAGFRGSLGGVLNLTNTFTIHSNDYWLESIIVDWTYPVKNTLLSVFYSWAAKAAAKQSSWLRLSSLLNTEYEQLRRESLELAVENTENNLRWTLTAGHEAIIRILGRLEFTGFIKLRFGEDKYYAQENSSDIFTFDALIGTSLRVSF